jgi:hypothetical protein
MEQLLAAKAGQRILVLPAIPLTLVLLQGCMHWFGGNGFAVR